MFVADPSLARNRVVTIPAPIGGLNARDSIAAMPETDALIMRNLWPQPYGCLVKKGSKEFFVGMPGEVSTLAGWTSVAAVPKIFAWSGTSMYDATPGGAAGAGIVAGLSTAKWETVGISNAAGSHLICVNGADNGILYNAAGVSRIALGDGIAANTWKNLDPVNAAQLTVHQGRVWAVEKNSSRAWYLPVGQIFGILISFDFGNLFTRGGYLQYLTTWTIDDGNGAEDNLVAVSSEGEAVVYAGTNPSDPIAWGLRGVYFVGAPVAGRRSYTKISGDLLLITQRGVVSMIGMTIASQVSQQVIAIKSAKIQFLVSAATTDYSALSGWQLIYAAPYNMLLLNVPTTASGDCFQYAANEIIASNPWTQFNGWNAASWLVYQNKLYYGDYTGRVLQAWTGTQEDVKLPTQISTNANFDLNVVGWTPAAANSLAWMSPNYARITQTAVGRGAVRQVIAASYLGKVLRLTATYRNISTVQGVSAVVYDVATSLAIASLPAELGNTFQTYTTDFLCSSTSIRVDGQTVGSNEVLGSQVEFDSVSLTVAPVGNPVQFLCQQAYSYLGALSLQKQMGMYRPNFTVRLPIAYSSAITYDFEVTDVTIPNADKTFIPGVWDSSIWGQAIWSGNVITDRQWIQAQGIGVAASLIVAGAVTSEATWVTTDYSYRVGSLL